MAIGFLTAGSPRSTFREHQTLLRRGINAAGHIVASTLPPVLVAAFCSLVGPPTVDVPGGAATEAYGINPAGQIVGVVNDAGAVPSAFVRDRDGTFTTITFPVPLQPTASLSTTRATSWECTKPRPGVPATAGYFGGWL